MADQALFAYVTLFIIKRSLSVSRRGGPDTLSSTNVLFNQIVGPDLSIGETEGVRIITQQASKLSCVSLANHEIAVSSFEAVQLLLRKCARLHSRQVSNRSHGTLIWGAERDIPRLTRRRSSLTIRRDDGM